MWIDILQVVIGGFIGWALHGSISFYIQRKNIRTYLSAAIPIRMYEVKENCKIMKDYFDKHVSIGKTISISPTYKADSLESITCVKQQVITYLTKDEILKFAQFIFCLSEIESLYESFTDHIRDHENKKTTIDNEQYMHILSHIEKAINLVNQLPDKPTGLRDLPSEYHPIWTF
ncbi:hypothetical protein [Methylomagnum ishizawai]|uniref:hypothetical protein n=1 Tax=Methylomagnum ishizawai TaxID=1760988 RepID=UPI001C33BA6D|nr:hypothetical protein [Methylomagnum ishizawai]BBL77519.1 hypothetical protein MishRS11D_46170 [Methylomagnum ishizawai]